MAAVAPTLTKDAELGLGLLDRRHASFLADPVIDGALAKPPGAPDAKRGKAAGARHPVDLRFTKPQVLGYMVYGHDPPACFAQIRIDTHCLLQRS